VGRSHVTEFGIPTIGKIPWGSHLCHFFSRREDLVHGLVPYFKAGLLGHERCIWITSRPLPADDATAELGRQMPELDSFLKSGQITIQDSERWYSGQASGEDVVARWLDEEKAALEAGYEGLRISGNVSFIERAQWHSFMAYEVAANRALPQRRIIALCSYELQKSTASDVFDVIRRHPFTLDRQGDSWEVIESIPRPLGK
jgi:hypothetical protein